jgi:hypothetical protein
MRRWLFVALAFAILTALFAWQWRAAAPLDVSDPAVHRELVSPFRPKVTIGHWEYTADWPKTDEPPIYAPNAGSRDGPVEVIDVDPEREPHFGGPSPAPRLPKTVVVRRRPLTLMARFRAWLGAD